MTEAVVPLSPSYLPFSPRTGPTLASPQKAAAAVIEGATTKSEVESLETSTALLCGIMEDWVLTEQENGKFYMVTKRSDEVLRRRVGIRVGIPVGKVAQTRSWRRITWVL